MQIQLATLEDVNDLCDLEYTLFPENNFNEITLANELTLGKCWLLQEDRKTIGYALMRYDGSLNDLLRLGIDPAYQNQGFGTLLLQKVLGSKLPTILTVRKDNLKALKLYLRHGLYIVAELEEAHISGWVLRTYT